MTETQDAPGGFQAGGIVMSPGDILQDEQDPLYKLGLTELVRRHRELVDEYGAVLAHRDGLQRELNTYRAGANTAKTEEQWTQQWLNRAAMYVERGKASKWAKLPKLAKQLEEAAAGLLQGLDDEQKRAALDAQIQAKRAELAALEQAAGVRTKTAGGNTGPKASVVRQWARAHGLALEAGVAGRVPASVIDAYTKAHT